MRLVIDRHQALLHGLEQGGLGLGRGAVDFIREQEAGEDGAFDEDEGVVFEVEDAGARDVRRHEVRGELDAGELAPQYAGQGAHQEGLAHARHPFHQHMVTGEDGDQGVINDVLLANDDFGDLARASESAAFTVSRVSVMAKIQPEGGPLAG